MIFELESKETAAHLEEKSLLIEKYQQSDPFMCGYPVVDHDAILYHYRDKVQKLLDISNLTPEEQEKHILKTLRNLIDCIHLIPASRHHHHRTMGGLLEHSIESAIFAAEIVRSSNIFRKSNAKSKKAYSKRLVLAAILCGLLHDAGKAVVDAQIYSSDKRDKYVPTQRFIDWANENIGTSGVYFVIWQSQPSKHEVKLYHMLKIFNIVDDSTYRWLGGTIAQKIRNYFKNSRSVFENIIAQADRKSIEYSMKRGQYLRSTEKPFDHERVNFFEAVKRLLFYGSQCQGNQKSKNLIDESAVKLCGWTINTPDSAVIQSKGCLYIVFNQLKQVRIAYEIDNVKSILFDFTKKTSDLSNGELEEELEKLVNYLKKMGCLRLCNESPYWYRQRDSKEWKSLRTICLNQIATKRVLEYKEPLIPGKRPYFTGFDEVDDLFNQASKGKFLPMNKLLDKGENS